MNTKTKQPDRRQIATKELALFVGFLFFGLVLLPPLIYYVGQLVFGAYNGVGYTDFFGTLSEKVRHTDPAAWFLVLSPYLGWQCLRLMVAAWKLTARAQ